MSESLCRCCTWQQSQTPVCLPPHLAAVSDDRTVINSLPHAAVTPHGNTPTKPTLTHCHRSEDNRGTSHSHGQNTDADTQRCSETHSCHASMKSNAECSLLPRRKKLQKDRVSFSHDLKATQTKEKGGTELLNIHVKELQH